MKIEIDLFGRTWKAIKKHSLQNDLNGRSLDSEEVIKEHLNQFFAGKEPSFYERGIRQLPERWQKVIDQNGQYIIDWTSVYN